MVEDGKDYILFVPKNNLTEDAKFEFMAFIPGHAFEIFPDLVINKKSNATFVPEFI